MGWPESRKEIHHYSHVGTYKLIILKLIYDFVDLVHLARNSDQGRAFLNSILNIPVPYVAGSFWSI